MKLALIGGVLVLGLIGSSAWAAESDNAASAPPANPAPASPLPPNMIPAIPPLQTEAQFLQQADEAAKAGDAGGAVQLYHSAIVYAPADPVPYERLAEFYSRAGQKELAQRYFGLALDAQPGYAPAVAGLAALQQLAVGTPPAPQP